VQLHISDRISIWQGCLSSRRRRISISISEAIFQYARTILVSFRPPGFGFVWLFSKRFKPEICRLYQLRATAIATLNIAQVWGRDSDLDGHLTKAYFGVFSDLAKGARVDNFQHAGSRAGSAPPLNLQIHDASISDVSGLTIQILWTFWSD
jgi:hypothetical protein